jgi:hypothetical protein
MIGVPHTGLCPDFRPKYEPPVRSAPRESHDDAIRHIPLTQGKYAIVDARDYKPVSQHKWSLSRSGERLYAQLRTHGKTLRMHEFIMNPPKGKVVDHINGYGLDNRRCNLRICARLQNDRNRRVNPNTLTGYKGVSRNKKTDRYPPQIFIEGRYMRLGPFATAEQAARAYDRKARELVADFARCNFPEE